MVLELVLCLSCGSEDIVKHGQLQAALQMSKCRVFSLHVYSRLSLSRLSAGSQAADCRDCTQWQLHSMAVVSEIPPAC